MVISMNVTKAIDMTDILRKDPSLAVIFKFYVSMVDVSEKGRGALWVATW